MGLKVSDTPMSNDEFRRFTVDCYNESEGDLDKQDGIQCVLCNNKGYIQVLEDGYAPYRKCKCMARRESLKRARDSGLGEYLNKTMDDYIAYEDWQNKCKRMVTAYLEGNSHNNVWFIACGQSGCGKTLLGSIIANTLLVKKGREVMYIIWTDFIGKVKRDIMGEKANEVSVTMDRVKNVDVLFLDEVIKKYNETDLKYLIEIINYRYANDKKTIITSERLMTEFLDIDEATFGRAVEKCEGFMINIPKDRKKNYRLRAFKL
jgi:DNA replication protein DnaC